MIAKLIVHAENRKLAIEKMQYALKNYFIFGITTNIPFLIALVSRDEFLTGDISTHFIEENLDDLNKKLISQNMIDSVQSFNFREMLFANHSSHSKEFFHVNIFAKQKFGMERLGPVIRKSFVNSKHQIEVNIDGEVIVLENPGYYNQHRLHEQEHEKEIKSPMPGKVYSVFIKPGDSIQKGALLFIIESMKIQLEVRSAQDGTIADVYVKTGEILTGTSNLATFL